jgi:hypothetical protein
VVAGYLNFCAVLSSGGLDCWGYNGDGALGAGGSAPDNACQVGDCASIPVPVLGVGGSGTLSHVYGVVPSGTSNGAIDLGFCALLTTGRVECWGDEGDGGLGNGVGTEGYYSDVPVQVLDTSGSKPLSKAVDGPSTLDGDGLGFCVVLTTKTVTDGVDCWGGVGDGTLGNPASSSCGAGCTIPVPVVGTTGRGNLSDVVSLATIGQPDYGAYHASSYCALLSSGEVDCWGDNTGGQLGNDTTAAASWPVSVFAPPPL